MIDRDKRKAICCLRNEGMAIREISRKLAVSVGTVRTIVEQKGEVPGKTRSDKIRIDPDLLARLHAECKGRVQRMHEKLVEERGMEIGYSTLTQAVRDAGLGKGGKKRCCRVPDEPGAEMQHDTSPYRVRFAGAPAKVQGSLLYFRYSKIRYLKFYRFFNRFNMKCFFHEALGHWEHAARRCVIDNTNLARKSGSGKKRRDFSGDGEFLPAVRLFVRLPRDRPREQKGGKRKRFLDGGNQLLSGTLLRESGGHESPGVRMGGSQIGAHADGKKPHSPPGGLRDRKAISDEDTAARSPSVPGALQKVRPVRLRLFRRQLLLGARGAKRRCSSAAIRGLPENLPGPGVSRALSAAPRRNEKQVDRTRRESSALAQAQIQKEADGQRGAIAAKVARHGRRISRLRHAAKPQKKARVRPQGLRAV